MLSNRDVDAEGTQTGAVLWSGMSFWNRKYCLSLGSQKDADLNVARPM